MLVAKNPDSIALRIVLSTLALTMAFACDYGGPGGAISAGDLVNAYERSSADVRSRYEGKEITVRGKAMLQSSLLEANYTEGLIAVKDDGGQIRGHVNCWFSQNNAANFANISENQSVVVQGIFDGENTTDLKFCRLVKP